ncbi:MAG: acyl-CoA dehydrogenase family protein [Gammaproteobacteria bacterium]
MHHVDSIEHRRFRVEVREWLLANQPREKRPGETKAAMAYDRAWQRVQFDAGWAGVAWPAAYGGRGLSPTQQLIWCEEYASTHAPHVQNSVWLGLNHAGPTLIARGNEAQKAFHLPKILSGEVAWCQGFSEPNAGSDLASLRTRGVVDGDHLVVNGQKIWTSNAHMCEYQELLVRTGPENSRHRGLTWTICDMRTPGIDIRPILALDGVHHNCEVFYDDVRIPLSNVVGEIDGGWSVAMTTFGFERGPASFGHICHWAVAIEDLVELARNTPMPYTKRPAIEDPSIAARLGIARAQMNSIRALMYQLVSSAEEGASPGSEGSIVRLTFTELEQRVARLAIEIMGARGLSRDEAQEWMHLYLVGYASTIAGGTAEIQRNIIGERLLGLPR